MHDLNLPKASTVYNFLRREGERKGEGMRAKRKNGGK
jgi:hypothetical protein